MKHKDKLLWVFSQCAVAFFLFCTISTASAQQTPLPAEAIAEKALAATVYLEMQDKNGKTLGIGSGFFVKSNLIATNYHVIEGAAKGTAKLVGKYTQYNIEGVTATDKINDLALLKVTAYGIKPLSLGDSNIVQVGETVYVAGNPKGLEGTFSDGIISSRRDRYTKERLQMTAPISPGSSGGPVLNRKGEVIGVSFSFYRGLDAQNLNFAIPSRYLKKLLQQPGLSKPLSQGQRSISAETYFQWGYAKGELGDYAGAITDYTKAIRLKPDAAEAYYNRGNVKGHLGQYSAAIADFDTAIKLKPNTAEAYYNRGVVKGRLGQYGAAIADYGIAIKLKPDAASAYINWGAAKNSLGQHAAAIADFDTAIRLQPNAADAYLNRGAAKANLGQYSAAVADYDIAIKLKPDYAKAYINRGAAKNSLGQHAASIADFDTAIKLQPNAADAYLNRGVAKGILGQHFAAIADFDTVIRLQPNAADAYINRGAAKNSLGQHAAAIADFDTAIRLQPNGAEAYYIRGVTKARLGRTLEARQDLRTALRLATQADDAKLKANIEKVLRILNK